MGDVRFARYYTALHDAADPAAILQGLPDEGVIAALAAASREKEPYLANVLATEAMNRALRWEALFNSLGEGVVVLGPRGEVLAINPAAENLLGWSAAEARGQAGCRLLGVADPSAPAGQAPFFTGPSQGVVVRADDETFRRKDGTPFQVAYIAAPIVREDEPWGVVIAFRDVTRRRAQERRRREADRALVALAKDPALREGTLREALGAIAEVAARVLGVARVSVWRYEPQRALIRCIHMHGGTGPDDGAGSELSASEHPAYFTAIESERTLAAQDARADPRTRGLTASYLLPLGITSMLDVPFRVEGQMEGIVCHEHQGPTRRWSHDEEAFAGAIADLVSLAIATDRRRRAEQKLREERSRLKTVVGHANVVLFALDNEGTFTLLEGRGLRALGLAPGETVGKSVFELYRHNPKIIEDVRRALEGHHFHAVHEEAGRIFETRWSSLRDATGARTGIVGVATDVTEQMRAQEALKASERRYADLMNAVDGIVWDGDATSLRYTFVSHHAENILGYPPERWIDEPDFWIQHIHPDDRDRVVGFCTRKTAQVTPHAIEYRMIAADGREVWLRDVVTVLGEGSRPTKSIGVMVDITELKAAEAALAAHRDHLQERVEERTRELKAANEELESFSRAVSHDLRGHLRGIDALSEALLEDEGPRLGEESRHALERIREEAWRMGTLVQSLLQFSLALGGNLRRERLDVAPLAEEVVQALRERDPEREVDVSIEPGIHVLGDPALVFLVVENLVGNAWKYTSKTPHARIEVATRKGEDGETVVMVRDNGAGFDMADAPLLFRPFQRLHSGTEFRGTGIGLATVKRIVERHGGRVWAEAEKGRGASFFFTLPEASRQATPTGLASKASKAEDRAERGGGGAARP